MGDTSSFNVVARIPDQEIRQAVRQLLTGYNGSFGRVADNRHLMWYSAHDISTGEVDECFDAILRLIENGDDEWECPVCKGEGKTEKVDPCLRCAGECYYHLVVPDFAFEVYDEPVWENMGSIRMHVPGLPDFSGDCDADGGVRVNSSSLVDLVDAATDLQSLRRDVAALTGQQHKAALYRQDAS